MEFSVLMPVYNKEKKEHLQMSLESIINQTLSASEIIIMEDGILHEELEDIICKYEKAGNIRVIRNKKNRGLGKTLQEGVIECKFPYIARMDCDDIAHKNRFEKQVKYLEEHQDIDILGSYIQEYDENMERKISIRKVPIEQEEIAKQIGKTSPFNHSSVIFKKEKVLQVGNYREIELEDYDLWIRMYKNNAKMHNLEEVLVDYRAGKPMYIRRSGIKYIKKIRKIQKILLSEKIINKMQYFKNMILHIIAALMPICLKEQLYKLIRKKEIKNI